MITLMTDFGTDSPYIAAMKAAIDERLPQAAIIDLTHAIPPQDIRQGAFVWCEYTKTFPNGTVNVGVVDPGVGSNRRIVAARCGGQYFVCPDNGLLTLVLQDNPADEVVEISNQAYRRPKISSTFHGRDIMAPLAAAIAGNVPFAEVGTPLDNQSPPVLLPFTQPHFGETEWQLEVLYIDHFGNLLLNATADMLPHEQMAKLAHHPEVGININGQTTKAIFVSHYSGLAPDNLVLLENSGGRLEVAVVNGNASERLSAKPGDRLTVRFTVVGGCFARPPWLPCAFGSIGYEGRKSEE